MRSIILSARLLCASLLLCCCATAAAVSVELREHPWPYRASLSISSDRHWGSEATLDAVHQLVMGEAPIALDSPAGQLLFGEHSAALRARHGPSIAGFGLPAADSFWLVDQSAGVFRRTGPGPAPLAYNSDYGDHLDAAMREGRFDTIHTFGTRPIYRAQAMEAASWLEAEPWRLPSVWVSHSFTETPSGSEPDVPALPMAVKNAIKWSAGLAHRILAPFAPQLAQIGAGPLLQKIAQLPAPYPYPEAERRLATLILAGGAGVLLLSALMLSRRLRRVRVLLVAWLLLCPLYLGYAWSARFHYSLGDDPGSPMYNIDLVHRLGVRFFWFIMDRPAQGYRSLIQNRLSLPTREIDGRRTVLTPLTLDDGSTVLAFSRNCYGFGGMQSLHLLSDHQLGQLIEEGGWSIVYTHWLDALPVGVFDDAGLEGLARLRAAYRSGAVWVAPTGEMLRHHRAASFLRYRVEESATRIAIIVEGIDDPARGLQPASGEELRGLSFAVADERPVELHLRNGEHAPLERVGRADSAAIWQLPL